MSARHLIPGLAVAPAPEAPDDGLPRMDVALFVGFAARGPTHRPIVVDSAAAFAAVFGPDLLLAADTKAALGPAVRAFFANGGARAHVVRVARTPTLEQAWRAIRPLPPGAETGGVAQTARFRLQGLIALYEDGSTGPAELAAASPGSWADRLAVAARLAITEIPFASIADTGAGYMLPAATPLGAGELVRLGTQSATYAVARRAADGVSLAPLASPASPPTSPPAPPTRLEALRLELLVSDGGEAAIRGPYGLTPQAPNSWFAQISDDAYYADPAALPRARSPLAALSEAEIWPAPAVVAWIPSAVADTLTQDWSLPVAALPAEASPLERDGLSRFDAELFLDPRLAEERAAALLAQAQFVRQSSNDANLPMAPLFGVHAALALPGGSDFAEPSLIAAPDLAQPGWRRSIPEPLVPPRPAGFNPPANWRGHAGPCAPGAEDAAPLAEPDVTRFLDCGVRLLPTPEFLDIKQTVPGPITLEWTASEVGAVYVLRAAGRPDFADAQEIYRGPDLAFTTIAPGAGAYYFDVHAELGANISRAAVTGVALTASDWLADADHYADATLVTVQRALLRICAALGDQFALLSLPRHYRSPEAAAHRLRLVAVLADNERAALRHAALYHPWPISADAPGAPLVATPPEGAAAGVFARRARERGAWTAPAGQPLADVLALENPIADADREKLAVACVNALARQPHGFIMTDAMTLSEEPDWREINVRRLVSLIRRAAIRTGATYVFEPNGDVLRRVIERRFGHMLDDLTRRGAFAGKGGPDSYRLMVEVTDADRMSGRLAIEIAIAPSRPLRFLTVVLAQTGERLAVVEER